MRILFSIGVRWRPVAWLLLGLLVIDGLIRSFQSTWDRYSPDDYRERVQNCARQPRDFVIVGGSPVSEGLDPARLTGLNWNHQPLESGYSIGLPGGTTTDVYHAVTHACPTWPKLLIYGIAPSDINDYRNEPHGAASLMSLSDVRELGRVRPDARDWYARNYLLSRLSEVWAVWNYRHGIRLWAANTWASQFPSSCPQTLADARFQRDYADRLRGGLGYAPAAFFSNRHYSLMKQDGWVAPPFGYLDRYKTGSHLKYLHKLIEQCRQQDCEFILLEMPLTADLESRHPHEVLEYRRQVRQICRDKQVHRLVATRTTVGLDDSHFADLIHLNAGGAALLTDWLKQELQQLDEGQP